MFTRFAFTAINFCKFDPPDANEVIMLGPRLAEDVVKHIQDQLLVTESGGSFGSLLNFNNSEPILMVCQRVGQTALLVAWRDPTEQEERLAASLLLSGLDNREDTCAVESVRRMWNLRFSDNTYTQIWTSPRPVVATLFPTQQGYNHSAIRSGVGCVAMAFSNILGLIQSP